MHLTDSTPGGLAARTCAFMASSVLAAVALCQGLVPTALAQPTRSATFPMAAPIFVENLGQWDDTVLFAYRASGRAVWITRTGLVLQGESPGADGDEAGLALSLSFEGASRATAISGRDPMPGYFNFIIGNNSTRWVSHARGFSSVEFARVWSGIDVRIGIGDSGPTLDFLLTPNADLRDIRIAIGGASALTATADGGVRVVTAACAMEWPAPLCTAVGAQIAPAALRSRALVDPGHIWRINLPASRGQPFGVISQGLDWSTFLGGSKTDYVWAIKLADDGESITLGYTQSPDFPTTAGSYEVSFNGSTDIFVARLGSDGDSLCYATYLGGTAGDGYLESSLALASDGSPVVGSVSFSPDFPVTPGAYDTEKAGTSPGSSDAVVARLSADGSELVFGTFLGGAETGLELPRSIAIDSNGVITVAGEVGNRDFPTTPGAFQESDPDGVPQQYDGFVT